MIIQKICQTQEARMSQHTWIHVDSNTSNYTLALSTQHASSLPSQVRRLRSSMIKSTIASAMQCVSERDFIVVKDFRIQSLRPVDFVSTFSIISPTVLTSIVSSSRALNNKLCSTQEPHMAVVELCNTWSASAVRKMNSTGRASIRSVPPCWLDCPRRC